MPSPLSMLKRPQIQGVVIRMRGTRASPQLRLQLMSDPTGVQITLQRSPAPFNGPRAQFLVGQPLCFDHGGDCDGGKSGHSEAPHQSNAFLHQRPHRAPW